MPPAARKSPKKSPKKPPVSANLKGLKSSAFNPTNVILLSIVVAILAYFLGGYATYNASSSTIATTTTTTKSEKVTNTAPIPKDANPEGKARAADRDCKDRYSDQCTAFAKRGECKRNPGWMIMNCPASCNSCSLRDPKLRCDRKKLNITDTPVYQPGDMNAMFENILTNYQHYGPTVLSNPSMGEGRPWVVTLDNFLSDAEVDALISTNSKFERSTDTGQTNEYGETGRILSQGRTSSNSWCRGPCRDHPDVIGTLKKIEGITGVPSVNYESFQVLKYEVGQKYSVHHDFGKRDIKLISGPRILTFFLYLSDVEEGGETAFPTLNLAVKPKKGKALLWPSVLNHDLQEQDPTTLHEAKPVIKGLKYAANSWIHLYNYEVPNLWGCTGTFDELSG